MYNIINKEYYMEEKNTAENKNFSKKSIPTIIAIITFIITFVIVYFVGIRSSTPPPSDSVTNPTYTYHSLNSKAQFDELDFTITSYTFDSEFCGITASDNANEILCIVNVKIHNPTNVKKYLYTTFLTSTSHEYSYKLTYSKNYSYLSVWANYTDFINAHESISPLQTITASLCYKIPKEISNSQQELELCLSKNLKSATEFHIWKLR